MFYCIFFLEIDYFREINLREIKVTCWEKKNNSMENLYLANPPRILGYLLSWWFNSWYLPLTMDFLGDFRGQERREDVNIWVKRQKKCNDVPLARFSSLVEILQAIPRSASHGSLSRTIHMQSPFTFHYFYCGKISRKSRKTKHFAKHKQVDIAELTICFSGTCRSWRFNRNRWNLLAPFLSMKTPAKSLLKILNPSKENETNLFKWSHLEHLMH